MAPRSTSHSDVPLSLGLAVIASSGSTRHPSLGHQRLHRLDRDAKPSSQALTRESSLSREAPETSALHMWPVFPCATCSHGVHAVAPRGEAGELRRRAAPISGPT